jgi:hypothetical protein
MRGRRSALKIEMDTQTRKTLLSWLRRQKTPAGLAKCTRAMLLLAYGETYSHTSNQVTLGERHCRSGLNVLSHSSYLAPIRRNH